MAESQNIEYKTIWKDEYLKWICGFANAQGGTIYIGKDDNGKVVGIDNAKKLLEELPNKITTTLGIVVDVNQHDEESKEYIEILVEPQPNPVNYKGEYHYRSGSTKQELKGAALDKFLLGKQGKRWDGVPIPNIKVDDLKSETFDFYRKKGIKSNRLNEDVLTDSNEILLNNIKLKEDKYLKRAAILLFHPDPERYVTNAYIKIGYFESDSELIYQDEIHGNLIEQVEKTMDLLFTKYVKAIISYEGIHRTETFEYPKEAIREALLNAVAHKDYTGASPIQISVYKDKMMIWNFGELPENWTIDTLQKKHSSVPHNPDISNAFFRLGYIEAWGRGIRKMNEQCTLYGLPMPLYYYESSGFWVEFRKDIYNEEILQSKGLNPRQIKAVLYAKEKRKITNREYQVINEVSRVTATRDLKDLVDKNIISFNEKAGAGASYELK